MMMIETVDILRMSIYCSHYDGRDSQRLAHAIGNQVRLVQQKCKLCKIKLGNEFATRLNQYLKIVVEQQISLEMVWMALGLK